MKRNQPSTIRLICFLLISSFVVVLSYAKGKNIEFQAQWPLYEALRNTSGIVFAVMGAWIAIVYPDSLKNASSPDSTEKDDIFYMLQAMLISALILSSVLLVGIAAPLIKQYEFLSIYSQFLRGISYALLSMMTMAQLWTLLITILPNYTVKRDILREKENVKLRAKMTEHKNRK